MKNALMAGAASFAHLMGRTPKAATPRADDDGDGDDNKNDRVKRAGESDEDYAKRMKEMNEKEKAASEDEEDEEDKEKADDSDGEEDEEMKGRRAERARWASVFASKTVVGRIGPACVMLSTTDMTAAQILGVLKVTPAEESAKAPGLANRMAGVVTPNVGDGAVPAAPSATEATTLANAIIAAGKKARGEK